MVDAVCVSDISIASDAKSRSGACRVAWQMEDCTLLDDGTLKARTLAPREVTMLVATPLPHRGTGGTIASEPQQQQGSNHATGADEDDDDETAVRSLTAAGSSAGASGKSSRKTGSSRRHITLEPSPSVWLALSVHALHWPAACRGS